MKRSVMKTAVCAALAALFLSGCDVSTPSQVSVRQIQLREGVKTETLDTHRPDPARVNVISESYLRNGKGPLSLTFSYATGGKASAVRQAAIYKKLFAGYGVSNPAISYVAVGDPAFAGVAVVSYKALMAEPPKDCGRITGYQGADNMDNLEKYAMGCETLSATSRMIANPADLLGRSGTPDDDAKREGVLVDKYRSGTPNPKLQGLNASTIGAGGGG